MVFDWHWGASNVGPEKLIVWLEPWADEFEVPPQSTIILKADTATLSGELLEVEWSDGQVVVWANGGNMIEVYIDESLQRSTSALVAAPEGLTKQLLNVVFSDHPSARLGGRPANARRSWFGAKLRKFFGSHRFGK